jgi:hypothetical protein
LLYIRGAALAGHPAALGSGDGVTRCVVAGDAVCDACNRRDRSHETDTFLLRSTGLLGVCPAKSREFYFGVVGEAPFAQSINRRYGINPLPLRLTGAFMGKLLQLGPCAGPPNVRLLIRYGCSSRRAAGRDRDSRASAVSSARGSLASRSRWSVARALRLPRKSHRAPLGTPQSHARPSPHFPFQPVPPTRWWHFACRSRYLHLSRRPSRRPSPS